LIGNGSKIIFRNQKAILIKIIKRRGIAIKYFNNLKTVFIFTLLIIPKI